MAVISIELEPMPRSVFARIVRGGATLGVVDGCCAVAINLFAFHQPSPDRTFQGVAAAILGRSAFAGGFGTAMLGVAIHFFVAFSWVSLYVLADRASPTLRRWASGWSGVARVGSILGIVIWFAMNFAVFPMTKVHHAPVASTNFEVYLIQHVLVVGPLIVAATR